MKVNIQATSAFLVTATVVQAASVSRRAVDPASCPSILNTANTTIWDDPLHIGQVFQDLNFFYVLNGSTDMRPLSQFIIQQGTDFESYMQDKMGNFQVIDLTNGFIDPWNSFLWKLNTVAGPILAAPYQIERTAANSDAWDAWFSALKDLTPDGQLDAYCDSNADDESFAPWAVGFPAYLDSRLKEVNEAFSTQPVNVLATRVWEVETSRVVTAPKSGVTTNGSTLCNPFSFTYEQSISQSTTSTTSQTYTNSFTSTSEVDVGAKASASFLGLGAEISTTIKDTLSESSAESLAQGTSKTTTETQTVTFSNTPMILPGAVLNITCWTDQATANIDYTGDLVYDAESTGIQTWIQGNGIPMLAGDVPILINNKQLTTPSKVRDVAVMAMNLLGADWSDAFLDNLFSPSVAGTAASIAGTDVIFEIWECDASKVASNQCNQDLAQQFPPPATSCPPTNARRSIQNSDDIADPNTLVNLGVDAILGDLDSDCYTVEAVEGHQNRWRVQNVKNCGTSTTEETELR
eukprot:Clim_evm7s81 gene=Clim_evmTU7s81